jgi:hypothetical protein
MALLWIDGMEGYDSSTDANLLENVKAAGSFNIAYGRRSGQQGYYANTDGSYYQAGWSGNPQTVVVGFAFYLNSSSIPSYSITRYLTSFFDAYEGNLHVRVFVNSSRLIEFRTNAGSILATSSGHSIQGYTWYYLEIKITISNTVGQITCEVNSDEVLNTAASLDTCNGSNEYAGAVECRRISVMSIMFDDLYVCDTTGSKNNDFLGDCRVDPVRPNAIGSHGDFSPSAGDNWQNTDDLYGPDGDSTYNDGELLGDQDSYNLGPLVALTGSAIYGLKNVITARKTDVGARKVKILTVSGGSDYLAPDEHTLSDSYLTKTQIYEDNPDDAADWEDADINAMEVGIEITE